MADFFSKEEEKEIVAAIKEAEKKTSGEICVRVEKHNKNKEVLDRAIEVFKMLNMHKTEKRNGVLFYLAYQDHRFAIIGDEGINVVTPADFWDQIKAMMTEYFTKGDFVTGLTEGIKAAGKELQHYFPYQSDDRDELPDEISKG